MADDFDTIQEEKPEAMPADWKKQGFDLNERLSLKHNALEAERHRARQDQKTKPQPLKPVKNKLIGQKIKSKIKDPFDEEEDEDESGHYQPIRVRAEENPLYNALDEDEKRLYQQKNTIKEAQMQQSAGKMEALQMAEAFARDAGLSGLDRQKVREGMNNALFSPRDTQEKIVREEVGGKLGVKGNVSAAEMAQAAKGIQKVSQMAGEEGVRKLKMEEAVEVGANKLNDQKIAELILEKSGQDPKKTKLKKPPREVKLKYLENDPQKKKISALKQKNNDLSR